MESPENRDHADVIAHPPVIYGLGLGIAVALDYLAPVSLSLGESADLAGRFLLFCGFVLVAGSILSFIKYRQNPDPHTPTNRIYTGGFYALSRNPIYLGFTAIYISFGLIFSSLWIFIFLIPVLFAMHYGVILREEVYLEEKFGEDYQAYKNRVRRWI